MEYTTLATLKSHLQITDNTQDTYLQNMITKASAMLSTELGDDLGLKTETKRYDGYGSTVLVFESVVNNVSSIEYTTNNGYSRNAVEIDYHDGACVYVKSILPRGYKNVRATYTKGYAEVPVDIEAFFLQYVSKMISEQKQENKEIKSKKIDDLTTTYFGPNELASRDQGLYADYDAIKNKYRVFSISISG